jgi:hypothetical protein
MLAKNSDTADRLRKFCCIYSCCFGLAYAYYTLSLRTSPSFNKITSGTFVVRAGIAQSVQRWATEWTVEQLGFVFGQEILIFSSTSGPALGSSQPLLQRVQVVPSPGLKRPVRETDCSIMSSA